jgi:hypothetical protein
MSGETIQIQHKIKQNALIMQDELQKIKSFENKMKLKEKEILDQTYQQTVL